MFCVRQGVPCAVLSDLAAVGGPKPPRAEARSFANRRAFRRIRPEQSSRFRAAGRSFALRRPATLASTGASQAPSRRIRSHRDRQPAAARGRRAATLASAFAPQAPSRRTDRTQCDSPQPPLGRRAATRRRARCHLRSAAGWTKRACPAVARSSALSASPVLSASLKMPAPRTARRSRAVRCASDPSRRCTAPRRDRGRFRPPRARRRACGRAAPRPPSASARPRGVRR